VKLDAVVTVPPAVVTVRGPLVAPGGTVVVILVAEFALQAAATDPKLTSHGSAKPVPVTFTFVPTRPATGLKMVTAGAIASASGLVADDVPAVTFTRPVVAAAGTVAVSLLADTTWNRALIPWIVTRFTAFSPAPVIVMIFPALACAGDTDRIDGPWCTGTTDAADDAGAAASPAQQTASAAARATLNAAPVPVSSALRGLSLFQVIAGLLITDNIQQPGLRVALMAPSAGRSRHPG
jgi:hypothetical protein